MAPATALHTAEPKMEGMGGPRSAFAAKVHAPAVLLFLGVAVHLLFLLSLRLGWLNPLFNDTCHRFGPGGDFFSIYAAGVADQPVAQGGGG